MKVDRVSTLRTTSTKRGERGSAARAGGFSKALSADESAVASAVTTTGAVGPIEALLAVQEVPDDLAGNRREQRRGVDLLDRLDELRLGLLTGSLPLAAIERLVGLVSSRRGKVDDPRLAAVLDEIEVRAAVELAKLGQ